MSDVLKVLIYGAGGHGRVVADILLADSRYQVQGFLSDHPHKRGASSFGIHMVGTGQELMTRQLEIEYDQVIIAIGNCQIRKQISMNLQKADIPLGGYVHPKAIVSPSAKVHSTALIWPGVVIQAAVDIAEGVILNTNVTVEHDCKIRPYAHISPGAVVCGEVEIGDSTWLGAGSTVIQQVVVGANCMIGAGSVIVEDVPDDAFGFGVPFRSKTKKDDGRLLV